MTNRALMVGCCTALSLVVAVAAQTPSPQPRPPAPAPAPSTAAPAPAAARPQAAPAPPRSQVTTTSAQERALLDQYCVSCHSEKAKAAGMDSARKLTLDNLDTANVAKNGETWELVVRKLRAGMMPPAGLKRPDPPVFESMIAYLENELDRQATPFMPPPGLHRLNRTEYANMIRDVLGSGDRPGQVPAERRLDARLRQHRRRAGLVVDAGRGVRVGGTEDQPAGHRRRRTAHARRLPDA